MKRKDLTGIRFGKLVVLREWGRNESGRCRWLCLCDCGKNSVVQAGNLQTGTTKSCGCIVGVHNGKDMTGQKFGRLTVLRKNGKDKKGYYLWLCLCDCGKEVTVSGGRLRSKHTRSCGCLQEEFCHNNVGIKNANYKPSKTDKERIGRHALSKCRVWSFAVKQRDNFVCIVCGKRGDNLESHHLDAWHWCAEKRFETLNGVTLCKLCHDKFHNKFGRYNNTEIQFNEFKKAQ